jgi:hypothetical protein
MTREVVRLPSRGQARERGWKARLAVAENPTLAEVSESEYANESPEQALATAESVFPGWMTSPVYTAPPLASGESVSRYLGTYEAAISASGGRRAALFSVLPLIGQSASGAQEPINLSLSDAAGTFELASSAAPVLMPSSATGEIRFLNEGFGLSLIGARDRRRSPAMIVCSTPMLPARTRIWRSRPARRGLR